MRAAAFLTVAATVVTLCTSALSAAPLPGAKACTIFPTDNAWNTRIADLPAATGSDATIAAIGRALEDVPRQARRYARWRARPLAERRPRLDHVLRPGPPPGLRRRASHEVHAILSECSWLAHTALRPDTS